MFSEYSQTLSTSVITRQAYVTPSVIATMVDGKLAMLQLQNQFARPTRAIWSILTSYAMACASLEKGLLALHPEMSRCLEIKQGARFLISTCDVPGISNESCPSAAEICLALLGASPVYTPTGHGVLLPLSPFALSIRPAPHRLIDIHLHRALTLPNTQV